MLFYLLHMQIHPSMWERGQNTLLSCSGLIGSSHSAHQLWSLSSMCLTKAKDWVILASVFQDADNIFQNEILFGAACSYFMSKSGMGAVMAVRFVLCLWVCSGRTWKGKADGVSGRTLYQEFERGRAGLSVAASSNSSLFAVGGNSIFYVYHCHVMTISETQSYSKVAVYLSPCACLNTSKSKWFRKKEYEL